MSYVPVTGRKTDHVPAKDNLPAILEASVREAIKLRMMIYGSLKIFWEC